MMISCLASAAPELYILSVLIAAYTNPQCHADLVDMPEAERAAMVEALKAEFEERTG